MTIRLFQIQPRDAFLLFSVSLLFTLPVALVGPPEGSTDLPHHLTITAAWQHAFESGSLIPDWVAPENNGYGAVSARYYPPLFHISYAAVQTAVGTWGFSLFLVALLWSFVGSLGIYVWSLDVTSSRTAALCSAAVFAFTPYHASQFYNSFMWAEFVSLSIVPFAFYFVRRQNVDPSPATCLGLAIAIASLILSNIPQLLVATFCLGIYFVITLERRTVILSLVYSFAASATALLLTSFFWVRLLREVGWLHITLPNTDPLYDFRNSFLLSELSVWSGISGLTPLFSTMLLVVTIVSVLVAVFSSGVYRTIRDDKSYRAVAVTFVTAVVFCTALSRPVWETFPLLERIQFPFRFLSVVSLCGSVLIGASLSHLTRTGPKNSRRAMLIVVGSILIMLTFTVKHDILTSTLVPNATFDRYAESTRTGIGLEHWRPTWTTRETFAEKDQVTTGSGRSLSVAAWDGLTREFSISAGQPTKVRTAIMYFPHWEATIEGERVPAGEEGGALTIEVPQEAVTVRLQFVEPAYTAVARWVSLVSLIAVTLLGVALVFRPRFAGSKLPVLSV